jgi:hypothetical protein
MIGRLGFGATGDVHRRVAGGRRRALTVVIALTVTLLTLTGCVGIPKSGPVSQGLPVNEVSGAGNIAYNPEGPEAGASQQNILRGFIASFTSATGGYAVAKQFLSSGFANKWDPRASVQVRTGGPKLLAVDASTIDYSFDTVAIVDKTGAYAESSLAATLQYSFVREKNQWRISAAPDGIVLAQPTFERIFTQRPLYFLDSTNTHLIPDLRWFPTGSTSMTRIVNAVLAGPPDWLKGAAFSRFPDGTALSDAGSVVTSDNGVATIDLTKDASAASARDRQLMKLQLFESLRLVPNVSSVSISVEGTPMQIDDTVDALQVDNKVDTQALVFRNNRFGFYANGGVSQLPALSQRVSALGAQAATLSSDQSTVAVLGTGGVSVVRRGEPTPPVDPRSNLIAPSLDEAGFTWSVPYDNPNAIVAFDPSGGSHPVSAPVPSSGSQIVSLEVSREGSRVLILLSAPSGPRLIVAAIVRDEKQVPVSIGTPILDLSLGDGEAIDATWVDQTTVATLVTLSQQSRVELYAIGGKRTSLDVLPSADEIVGGNNGADGLRVLGDDQSIWVYRGSSWQRSNVTVSFIATQR